MNTINAMKTMKGVMFNQQNTDNDALYYEILEYGSHKFQIVMDIHNGSRQTDTNLSIMLPDGTWGFVVSAKTLGIKLKPYIACDRKSAMDECYQEVRRAFTDYIKKVYA